MSHCSGQGLSRLHREGVEDAVVEVRRRRVESDVTDRKAERSQKRPFVRRQQQGHRSARRPGQRSSARLQPGSNPDSATFSLWPQQKLSS